MADRPINEYGRVRTDYDERLVIGNVEPGGDVLVDVFNDLGGWVRQLRLRPSQALRAAELLQRAAERSKDSGARMGDPVAMLLGSESVGWTLRDGEDNQLARFDGTYREAYREALVLCRRLGYHLSTLPYTDDRPERDSEGGSRNPRAGRRVAAGAPRPSGLGRDGLMAGLRGWKRVEQEFAGSAWESDDGQWRIGRLDVAGAGWRLYARNHGTINLDHEGWMALDYEVGTRREVLEIAAEEMAASEGTEG